MSLYLDYNVISKFVKYNETNREIKKEIGNDIYKLKIYTEYEIRNINIYKLKKYFNEQYLFNIDDEKSGKIDIFIDDIDVFVSLYKIENKIYFSKIVLKLGEQDSKPYRISIYDPSRFFITKYNSYLYLKNSNTTFELKKDNKYYGKFLEKIDELYKSIENNLLEIGIEKKSNVVNEILKKVDTESKPNFKKLDIRKRLIK